MLGRPDTVIAAGHFTDEVFGRVTREGGEQRWTPVADTPASR
ncbi:hypothetical protein ACWDGI_12065 [Streptomyces sp. NPDC001220]